MNLINENLKSKFEIEKLKFNDWTVNIEIKKFTFENWHLIRRIRKFKFENWNLEIEIWISKF